MSGFGVLVRRVLAGLVAVTVVGSGVAAPRAGASDSGVITGRITDRWGEPVAGAQVTAYRDGDDAPIDPPGDVTDGSGLYRITGLAAGEWAVNVAAGSALAWYRDQDTMEDANRVSLAAGASVSGIDQSVNVTSRVAGTVTGASGATATMVRLVADADPGTTLMQVPVSQGRYSFTSVPAGSYRLQAVPTGGLALPTWRGGATPQILEIAEGEDLDGFDIALTQGVLVQGTVRFDDGQPAGGLEVSVAGANATSTTQGHVTLGPLPAGSHPLVLSSNGRVWTRTLQAEPAGVTLTPTWTIEAGAQLSGVVRRGGATVPDAQIIVQRRGVPVDGLPLTDEDGRYRVIGLPAGDYTVSTLEGGAEIHHSNAGSLAEATVIRLKATDAVSDADITVTAPRITGRVTSSGGGGLPDVTVVAATAHGEHITTATDTSGNYALELPAPGTVTIGVPEPGVGHQPGFWGGGAEPDTATPFSLRTGQSLTRNLVLPRLLTVSARLSLTSIPEREEPRWVATLLRVDGERLVPIATRSGSYPAQSEASFPVVSGSYRLRFAITTSRGTAIGWYQSSAGRTFSVEAAKDLGSISVNPLSLPSGSVSGKVIPGLPSVTVTLASDDGMEYATVTDAAGGYVFGNVPPGLYRLTSSGASGYAPTWFPGSLLETAATLEVGTAAVRLAGLPLLPRGSQRVRVTADEVGLADALVTLTRLGEDALPEVTTGSDGVANVAGVVLGARYRLQAERAGYVPIDQVVVAGPADLRVPLIRVVDPGSISGVTRDASGAPLGEVEVSVLTAEGRTFGSTTSDEDGSYTITGLQPGSYLVRSGEGVGYFAAAWRPGVTVRSGEVAQGADLRVVRGGLLDVGVTGVVDGVTMLLPDPQLRLFTADGTLIGVQDHGTALRHGTRFLLPVGGYQVCASSPLLPEAAQLCVQVRLTTQERTATTIALGVPDGITAGSPTITGTARTGLRLTATPGTWAPAPVLLRYQWLRNGTAIPGATTAGYTPSNSDAGALLSVRVSGVRWGLATTSKTSSGITSLGVLTARTPTISGTPAVGSALKAVPGSWTPTPTFNYQWLVEGIPVPKATGAIWTPTAAQAGKRVSVRVTATRAGYASTVTTSALTLKVALAPTPAIKGKAKVGATLTVSRGTWSATSFSYRWYANGKAISKATKASLKLPKAVKGKKVTVTVTGKRSGYPSLARTSKPTAVVK